MKQAPSGFARSDRKRMLHQMARRRSVQESTFSDTKEFVEKEEKGPVHDTYHSMMRLGGGWTQGSPL
jgi:hypothetical protein